MKSPARIARRHAELTRMQERVDFVPTYHDVYAADGTRLSATYGGHRRVLARGVRFPALMSVQRTASQRGPLLANVSHIDLTRASRAQLKEWARV